MPNQEIKQPEISTYSPEELSAAVAITGGMSGPPESDRNLKDHFLEVDSRKILEKVSALPITTWNYKKDDPSIRHMGPMAQDFAAAFEVGEDDKHIHAIDGQGVALAAIQALYQMVAEKDAMIGELKKEHHELRSIAKALKVELDELNKRAGRYDLAAV